MSQRVPRKVLTSRRKVDDYEPLVVGASVKRHPFFLRHLSSWAELKARRVPPPFVPAASGGGGGGGGCDTHDPMEAPRRVEVGWCKLKHVDGGAESAWSQRA